jgi:lysophospholipase L1-like esterase
MFKKNTMKKGLFFLVGSIITIHATSQTVSWDSTFRPNNYVIKTGQFRAYPNSAKDIIFLGNSITAGTDWNELLGLTNARNRGISGDITFGVLERMDEVTEGKPAKVFILIGINDIQRDIPDSIISANHLQMIRRIKTASPGTKIFFQTLLPVNNEFTQFKNHYNKDEHIRAVNEALKKMAAAEKITLIDLHPHFLNKDNKLDKQYTMDGLHLNAAGYKLWASILKNYVSD